MTKCLKKIMIATCILLVFSGKAFARGTEITSCSDLNELLQKEELREFAPIRVDLGSQDCLIKSTSPVSPYARPALIEFIRAGKLSFVTNERLKRAVASPSRAVMIRRLEVTELDLRFEPFSWEEMDGQWRKSDFSNSVYLRIGSGSIKEVRFDESSLIHVYFSPTIQMNYEQKAGIQSNQQAATGVWRNGQVFDGAYLLPVQYKKASYHDLEFRNVTFSETIDLSQVTLIRPRFEKIRFEDGNDSWFRDELKRDLFANLSRRDVYALMQPKLDNLPEHRLSSLHGADLSGKDMRGYDFKVQVGNLDASEARFHSTDLSSANLVGIFGLWKSDTFTNAKFFNSKVCPTLAQHLLDHNLTAESLIWFLSLNLETSTTCGSNAVAEKQAFISRRNTAIYSFYLQLSKILQVQLIKDASKLNLFDALISVLGEDLLSFEDVAIALATTKGINIDLASLSDRQLLYLLAKPDDDVALSLSQLLESSLLDLKDDASRIWQSFIAQHPDVNFSELWGFEAKASEQQLRARASNLVKIINSLRENLSERKTSQCSQLPDLSLAIPCPGESKLRSQFRSLDGMMKQALMDLDLFNNTLDLIASTNTSLRADFTTAYREILSLETNPGRLLPVTISNSVASILRQDILNILELDLRKSFVDVNAGFVSAQSSLLADLMLSLRTEFDTALNLANKIEQARASIDQNKRYCEEKDLLQSNIENLAFQKASALNALDAQLELIQDNIASYQQQKRDSESNQKMIQDLINIWCGDKVPASFQRVEGNSFPSPNLVTVDNTIEVEACKARRTFVATVEELHFGIPQLVSIGGEFNSIGVESIAFSKGPLRGASRAERGEYIGYVDQYKKEAGNIVFAEKQIETLNARMSTITASKTGTREKTETFYEQQRASQEKILADREKLCLANYSVSLPEDELENLVDDQIHIINATMNFAIDAISFYQSMLGDTTTLLATIPQAIMNPGLSAKDKLNRLELQLRTVESAWSGFGGVLARLNSSIDNRMERIIIPMSPIFTYDSGVVAENQGAELDSVRALEEFVAKTTPKDFKQCVASSIYRDMQAINQDQSLDTASLYYSIKANPINWQEESDILFNWELMRSWYGHQLRQSISSEMRNRVRRVWALWKYQRLYQQFWSTYFLLNRQSNEESRRAQLQFDIGADLVKDAESTFIVGIYPINFLKDGDTFVNTNGSIEDYFLSSCSSEDMARESEEFIFCDNRQPLNFFFNYPMDGYLEAQKSLSFYSELALRLRDNLYWNFDVFKAGVQLAGSLRGREPLLRKFTLSIESLPRRKSDDNSYVGTALVINLLRNSKVRSESSMNWIASNLPIPKDAAADRLLSDIYFPNRESALFDEKVPHDWLLSQDELTPECAVLKDSIN